MRDTQSKWMEALESRAKQYSTEAVIDKSATNVGTLTFQSTSGFKTYLVVHFNFQGPKLSLQCDEPIFADRPNPRHAGFEGTDLENAIQYVLKAVHEKRKPRAAARTTT